MLDEKTLHDLMTTAAEDTDHLLAGPVADDLARGHRRLWRARALTAAGALTAAAAVTAVVIAGTTLLGTDSARDDDAPVATNSSTAATTTSDKPLPPVRQAAGNLGPAIRAALTRHLDPGREHLVLTNQAIAAIGQPGLRIATGQAGWKVAGQQGQGVIYLEVADSERAIGKPCPNDRLYPIDVTCSDVAIGNGRTVQIGHQGEAWEAGYVRSDGTVVHVAVRSTFAQNTGIAIHDSGITKDMLVALVQDDGLRMPAPTPGEQQVRERLFAFSPDPLAMRALLRRTLTGGTVSDARQYFVPEQAEASVVFQPTGSAVRQRVAVSVDVKTMASSCQRQIRVDCRQQVTLPNGATGWYGEDKAAGRIGVRYEQPDGDMAFAVAEPGGGVTREQLFQLVVDPALADTK